MNPLALASRVFCSNPFSFALGVGLGVVGLYIVNKIEEQRKLEKMQREIEAAVLMIEKRQLSAPVEAEKQED
ncbi:MAG: hypothetical protein N2Z80_04315 [Hydrogenothermaceae bacterium]|nr:hypothetical protein [Hydrogenothermaceae bacterium]